MNRASPEMLHGLTAAGICADMTVLERQTARLKWNQHQLPYNPHNYSAYSFPPPIQAAKGAEIELEEVKPDLGLGKFEIPTVGFGSGVELTPSISRTSSSPPVIMEVKNRESISVGRESLKKRKTNAKIVAEKETKEKRIKVCADEEESKVTDQIQTTNNSTAPTTIRETSEESSKASEVQKSDYIHVRARRGQATDSHSLAERARREKISERMKYLQDLVPGCNKITGKAGMLDEIINYVQSLQTQVEFLSMKLAAVNPILNFNLNIDDDVFPKEARHGCGSNFPPVGIQSELNSNVYLHFDQSQQMGFYCGLEMSTDSSDMGLRRTISAPPENVLDSGCFPISLAWDGDLESLYDVGFESFDQRRT